MRKDEGSRLIPYGPKGLRREDAVEGPRSDFTYKLLENKAVRGVDLSHSMFQGAILRNCRFHEVNFFRSDFDATRFENCRFEDCNMVGDFRSALVGNSQFSSCDFSTSYIRSTTFIGTTFLGCTFSDCAISENTFTECDLQDTSFAVSSFLNNSCQDCTFRSVFFGDCTMLYVIMKGCRFMSCAMNLESVGTIYGLTRQNIASFNYYFRGERQELAPSVDIFRLLLKEYSRRGWRLGVCVLRLNLRQGTPFTILGEYLNWLLRDTTTSHLVNKEELSFVTELFEELALEARLPLAICLRALDVAAQAAELAGNLSSAAQRSQMHVLADFSSRTSLLLQSLFERMDVDILQQPPLNASFPDRSVLLTVKFNSRPRTEMSELLNFLGSTSGFEICRSTESVKSQYGSFTEILLTSIQTVLAFQLFLFLLNGCIIQLTEMKQRIRVLLKKEPKEYASIALRPKQQLPTALLVAVQNLVGKIYGSPWSSDENAKDLGADNIIGMSVTEVEPREISSGEGAETLR